MRAWYSLERERKEKPLLFSFLHHPHYRVSSSFLEDGRPYSGGRPWWGLHVRS